MTIFCEWNILNRIDFLWNIYVNKHNIYLKITYQNTLAALGFQMNNSATHLFVLYDIRLNMITGLNVWQEFEDCCLIIIEFGIDSLAVFLGGDGTYHFKVLVPSVAAGAIIGKGGETIAQLQKDTGARVKMSKSHDFYPGT